MRREIRPGLGHIDHQIVPLAFNDFVENAIKYASLIDVAPTQGHYRSLAGNFDSIAGYKYAFQYPAHDILDALTRAAQAWLQVFKLRGTTPHTEVMSVIDPTRSPDDPKYRTFVPKYPDRKDYSFTNPGRTLSALFDVILTKDEALIREFAALVGHPSDADHAYPRSEDSTPNHQHLAYALKAFLLGDSIRAELEIKKVRLVRHIPHIWHEAQMLRAIISNDCSAFLNALEQVLSWHRKQARKDENRARPKLFMCIPALALCRLAIQRGVCKLDDLPQDNVFLPLELISDTELKP